jgi:hypothetical protein
MHYAIASVVVLENGVLGNYDRELAHKVTLQEVRKKHVNLGCTRFLEPSVPYVSSGQPEQPDTTDHPQSSIGKQ